MATLNPPGTVYVVDDDYAVRDALGLLFRTAGLPVEEFESAAGFLEKSPLARHACLVLDIRMPGMTGTMLQDRLIERGAEIPIIFITAHGDIPMAVDAMKKGAVDFVEKPFDDLTLLAQVRKALAGEAIARRGAAGRAPLSADMMALISAREQEVLDLVLAGKPSRQIALELFISVKTVDFHRARIMNKLQVRSVAELFRLCLGPPRAST